MVYNRRFSSLSRFKSNRRFGSSSGFKRSGIRKYFPTIKKRSSFKRFKRTFKKFPKRKIDFRSQENQLRSAIVSRKFKTFTGMVQLDVDADAVRLSSLDVAGLLKAPVLLGHIAEYEQFAVSYIKVKAKFTGGTVDSFIIPFGYRKEFIADMDSAYFAKFQKQTVGPSIHLRKQNFLAHHKAMRTTPWVDVQQFILNPDAYYATLLPMYPLFKHKTSVDSEGLSSFELSLYVVTKNKKVQSLDAYTGVTEKKVDLVQVDRARNENDSGHLYFK